MPGDRRTQNATADLSLAPVGPFPSSHGVVRSSRGSAPRSQQQPLFTTGQHSHAALRLRQGSCFSRRFAWPPSPTGRQCRRPAFGCISAPLERLRLLNVHSVSRSTSDSAPGRFREPANVSASRSRIQDDSVLFDRVWSLAESSQTRSLDQARQQLLHSRRSVLCKACGRTCPSFGWRWCNLKGEKGRRIERSPAVVQPALGGCVRSPFFLRFLLLRTLTRPNVEPANPWPTVVSPWHWEGHRTFLKPKRGCPKTRTRTRTVSHALLIPKPNVGPNRRAKQCPLSPLKLH